MNTLRTFNQFRNVAAASLLVVFSSLSWADEPMKQDAGADILSKYFTSFQAQQDALKGMSIEVEISADIPKLHKTGRMSALRRMSQLGKVTYKMLGFSGDDTIKTSVIANYLKADTQSPKDTTALAITTSNYKFKYKNIQALNGRQTHVFEIKPKEKRVGLFKGELWIDAETFLPVRESGRFVRTPSVFLKRVDFTRDYELRDGVSLPKHIKSVVDTRIVGPADINVEYGSPHKWDPETDNLAPHKSDPEATVSENATLGR